MKKLLIENEKDFRITRYVENEFVRFKYNNKKYQIRFESTDTSLTIVCYILEEYNEDTNKYEDTGVIELAKFRLEDVIKDVSKHKKNRNITYTNVDKTYMIKMFTHIGLFCGKYDRLCEITNEQQAELNAKIKELEKQIDELEISKENIFKKYFSPTGHGSKLYDYEIKQKMSDRNLGSGYKQGDFVEEYQAKIGDTHPLYGGKLTDLRNLPYGTIFKCCNGNWTGNIGYNRKGNKAVIIPYADREIEVSEEYCCLYIEIIGEDD